MRLSTMIGTWLLALLGATSAHAIPMNFSVFYDGSVLGGAGTGSFTFDDATSQVTDFTFTFGNFTGALPNQNLSFPVFGAPIGRLFFEVLSGQDAHPLGCGLTTNCGVNLTGITDLVRFAMFNRNVGNMWASYEFSNSASTLVFAGMLTVQQVPEPAGLALIGLGVLGVAFMRRRRRPQ